MIPIENWTITLIAAFSILIIYTALYKFTLKKKLHILTEEHKVAEPHNDLKLLKDFIEKCWSKGYSIPEIKSILMEKGWNEDTINKVFYKSSIPNEEQKNNRIKRAFKIKPKKVQTQVKPSTKPQIKVQKTTKKSTPSIPIKKEKNEKPKVKVDAAEQQAKDFEMGDATTTTDDDYKESDAVVKLKKEVLKDVKEE